MKIERPTIENQKVDTTLKDIANSQIVDTDDLYQFKRPASKTWRDYEIPERRGFVDGLIGGLPRKEGYQPTIGEAIGAAMKEWARSATDVAIELWDPKMREARESVDKLRSIDPDMADMVESEFIGKRLTDRQLAVKGVAALGEGVLSLLPFTRVGRALLAGGKAAKAGRGAAILRNFSTGGFYGGLYSGFHGLHTEDGDIKAALRHATIGAGIGAGVGAFAGPVITGLGRGVGAAGRGVATGVDFVSDRMPEFIKAPKNVAAKWVYSQLFPPGSIARRYFGEVGENLQNMMKKVYKLDREEIGSLHLQFIDEGLMKPPLFARKVAKGVPYIGGDEVLMSESNRILRGLGVYADKNVRDKAIQSKPYLQLMDWIRKKYGALAEQAGVMAHKLDPETYLPKYTAEIPLSRKSINLLKQATTDLERELIYAQNSDFVRRMVETSVFDEKAFPTLIDSYQAYYDYIDFVKGGRRIVPTDNAFLRKIVSDGKARNINEAAGMLVKDLDMKKETLTPRAGSLDFRRNVDLPWYDPNPARTLPVYATDASLRIRMAQTFGVHDEVLDEMIGQIRTDPVRGADALKEAAHFAKIIRQITGQIDYSPAAERVSQVVRAFHMPKLFFAQILNLGQNMNYLLATDFGSTFDGLQRVFRNESMRKSIESGVLMNNFLREAFEYTGGGSKFADIILTYTGFTWTEMFNRSVGAVVSERWAFENFKRFMSQKGKHVASDSEKKRIAQMILAKREAKEKVLLSGLKIQNEFAKKFQDSFPEDDFKMSVGSKKAIENKRIEIEETAELAIKKKQNEKRILERKLDIKARPITDELVGDLKKDISRINKKIKKLKPEVKEKTIVDSDEIDAINRATERRRAEMEFAKKRLEETLSELEMDEIAGRDAVIAAKLSPGEEMAQINNQIKRIDQDILDLNNQITEKFRFLDAIENSYDVAEKRIAKEFPDGLAYDKFVEKQRAILKKQPQIKEKMSFEESALRELNIDVEEAMIRGFLSDEDMARAANALVERTQFTGQNIDLPGFASSPLGKVIWQFRSFTYQQMRFLAHELKRDFAAGNFKRGVRSLLVLGALFPMTGEVLGNIRSLMTGSRRPTRPLDRYLDNLANAGAWGLALDFINATDRGKIVEFLGGVTVAEAMKFLEGTVTPIFEGDTDKAQENFTKQLLRTTGVGRIGVNVFFPPTGPGKTTWEELVEWSGDE